MTSFLASTDEEFDALMKTDPKEVVFIRTMADWRDFVQGASGQDYPLAGLTLDEIDAFSETLIFRNGGLAGAYYGDIARRLTYFQFRELWVHFGITMRYFEDHKGYSCYGTGTCRKDSDCICTSNC